MINKDSKIYIAGHTGLVGSAVVRRYQRDGYTNLILKTRGEVDLLNQQMVRDFFMAERPEFVILCAAKVGGIKHNMTFSADFTYDNLQIQNNVIWQAHLSGVKKLLFLGSACIYPRLCPQPISEDYLMEGKLEPTNEGYAIAKIAGIKLCEKIYEQYHKTFISCMPTNTYGENDNFDPDSSHVISALIRKMHEAKVNNFPEITLWGSGSAQREFIYVDDLADAIFWIMLNYNEKPFLNIGTGNDLPIRELAVKIKETVGYKGIISYDYTIPDGMPKRLMDVSKLNKLGWHHSISLDEGLKKIYDFYLRKYCS
ncbi:GDP-L-fucose synthase family protein [Candidatus Magnetobacterium casense]|uniref:GDP-L-fucose synthase n=1 Tax=Candidatus Magnetobacterium casense TaxID=1455061 RepID=A0ABS6RUL5_9BACT|nr:GDP-L-fucose synthase [Candidatus Magnetobacterium casensis]MBV6340324.1 GDP-L-fucose synthase [Candidatus Magnetobacterium casensis]